MAAPFDPVQEAKSLVRVLFGNLPLALPYVIGLLVPVLILMAFGGPALIGALISRATPGNSTVAADIGSPTFFIGVGLAVIVGLYVSLLATGATFGASADVLSGRPVDLASMMANGLKHAGNIFGYYFILICFGLLAEGVVVLLTVISGGILAVPAGLLLMAAAICAGFLLVYGLPALVVGKLSVGDAILESGALARANLQPTIVLILAGIVVALGTWVVSLIFGFIPIIGQLTGLAAQGLGAAYFALASVRFYTLLSETATPTVVVTTSSVS